jgi:AraC-like DNA-binding protein
MAHVLQERVFHPTYVRLLCAYLRTEGISISSALAGTGLTWHQLQREKRLVPIEPVRGLVLNAKRLTRCAALGLEFGRSVGSSAHGLAGMAVATSRDVLQAIRAAVDYRPLRGRAAEFELTSRRSGCVLAIHEPYELGDIRTFVLEAQAVMVADLLRAVAGGPLPKIEYGFPYPAPAWSSDYARLLAAKVRFDARQMEIRLPASVLHLPGMLREDDTRSAITVQAERELAAAREGKGFALQVRNRLAGRNDGYPSILSVAKNLNVSSRTLLRRLKRDGTTFQRLLDDVRKEEAKWYLRQTSEPISDIAERLGYGDTSNFSRTFRRWFGQSPSSFRQARRRRRSPGLAQRA